MNTLLDASVPANRSAAWKSGHTLSIPAPAGRLAAAGPRARILYVDDEPQLRRLCELVLVRSGYEVSTADDGVEGWDALQHAHYNLLVTDHDMPRLSGLELAARPRRAGMRLPIMMTSGSPGLLEGPTCARLGLAAFLPKPFTPDLLVKTVEQALIATNPLRQCSGVMDPALAHIGCSVQPYLHGGINE